MHSIFTLLDYAHALAVWEDFKTEGNHSHNQGCNFHIHRSHIHHAPIFPSVETKIKPCIPIFAMKLLMKIAISISFPLSYGIVLDD